MDVRFLGAHNCESRDTRCMSILIDGRLVLDAGGLTSSLSFTEQQKLVAILLTHHHYDHIRDIPAVAMNMLLSRNTMKVFGSAATREALSGYLLNNDLYPRFLERPPENPVINFNTVTPLQPVNIGGYNVLPVPLIHAVPALGYQVTAPDGKTIFYTGDTGAGLADCWPHISPQLLIIEVTASNLWQEEMGKTCHLTPDLLKQELSSFARVKGYLPRVVTVHMNPFLQKEIQSEITAAAQELHVAIELADEGMQIRL